MTWHMNFVLTAQGWPQRAGHECRRIAQDDHAARYKTKCDCSIRQCVLLLPYVWVPWSCPSCLRRSVHRISSSWPSCYKEQLISPDDRTGHIAPRHSHVCQRSWHFTIYTVYHLYFNCVWFWQAAIIYLAKTVNAVKCFQIKKNVTENVPECTLKKVFRLQREEASGDWGG